MKTEKDLLMKLIELYEKQESIKIKCKILSLFSKYLLTNAAGCGIIEGGYVGPAAAARARFPHPRPHMQNFSYF